MKGWLTTDAEELKRRRERARSESFVVESLTPEHDPFGDYAIRSEQGARDYRVEIRARVRPTRRPGRVRRGRRFFWFGVAGRRGFGCAAAMKR